MIRNITISILFFTLFACKEDDIQTATLNGSVELVDEYGNGLSDHSGVSVTILTDSGEKNTETDIDGNFQIALNQSEKIEEVTYQKNGFANQQLLEDFERIELQTVELIQISTLEVYNLEAEEMDCGSATCFRLSFDAHHFFTDQVEKRYFDLHAYHNNQLVGTQRFFSFQETFNESNQITPISENAATIEIDLSGLWFLNEFSNNTEIELRVYGATAHETYLYYDLDSPIDNSLNPIYGKVTVRMM